MQKVDTDIIAQHLLEICKKENRDYFTPKVEAVGVEKAYSVFKNIAMFSNGFVRQALATLEAVLCMVEGGERFDPSDVEVIRKIVGRFVESPEVEPNIATYLISGVYSARYGLSLSYALKLLQSQSSLKSIIEKTLDTHLQCLYFMVDPNQKIANLTDPFYNRIYASLKEAAKTPGGIQLTHLAAGEMVTVFMELISQLGMYLQDERRLVVAATLKLLEIVNKYRHLAYTPKSMFHKVIAPELLKPDVTV
jgi:hypothetical protein